MPILLVEATTRILGVEVPIEFKGHGFYRTDGASSSSSSSSTSSK